MKSKLVVLIVWLIALMVSAATLSSCGHGFGLGMDYWDEPWGSDVYLSNGDRRDDYIYYRGYWHYRGYGTPYNWYY